MVSAIFFFFLFFFNDTATTEIYTLSLHDALPIFRRRGGRRGRARAGSWQPPSRPSTPAQAPGPGTRRARADRKSTRLNSSHGYISYAVFCLKKKKNKTQQITPEPMTRAQCAVYST